MQTPVSRPRYRERLILAIIALMSLFTLPECSRKVLANSAFPQSILGADDVTVHAVGRGNPWIRLADGREVPTSFTAASKAEKTLQQGSAQPLSLTSADFDEDGVPDLLCGYSGPGGGILSWIGGNVDSIYPNTPEAQQRRVNGEFTDSPFLRSARAFELPRGPDFIGAGDFDADGHWDAVTAARGDDSLYLSAGDGHGSFAAARPIKLPGRITAMATGEVNRADGLTDLVVGIVSADGPKALVFESLEGALRGEAEEFDLPGEATSIALGDLDNDYEMDMAIAAANALVVVYGRDRKLWLDRQRQMEVPEARISRRAFPFALKGLAIGDFKGDHKKGLALLTGDGGIHLLTPAEVNTKRKKSSGIKTWRDEELIPDHWSSATTLVRARVSSIPADDLVIVDPASSQLHIVAGQKDTSAQGSSLQPVSLDVESEPVAVLPMRLSSCALNDLVLLRSGAVSPTSVVHIATAIPVINGNNSGLGSLRQAIIDSNGTPGLDVITFNIGGGGLQTINLTSPLPIITDPVTIDGTTQPGFAGSPIIELNGNLVSAFVIDLFAGASTIRGLVINRADNAILLQINGLNVVEGNFLGTDPSGSVALGNTQGVFIPGLSSNNVIGGTAAAARNIISGNTVGISIFNNAAGNSVLGNFIGTDASGNFEVGNSFNGIQIGNGASGTTVGGTAPGARNIISGGSAGAIVMVNTATGNSVLGNFIGTDASGTLAIGFGIAGIRISDASGNTVGGTAPGARNIISGNGTGVEIGIGGSGTGNAVLGNFIGTDASGSFALGNVASGVLILNNASGNSVGGASAASGNIIAFNGAAGVNVKGAANGNAILSNSIFSNNGLGIDLDPLGVTPNDPCDLDVGPNNLQNSPVLTSAFTSAGVTTIRGTLNSISGTTFTIQFFSNDGCDPTGFGEGQNLIGSTTVTTDAGCSASFIFTTSLPIEGQVLTATATDPSGNTSEFSPCIGIAVASADVAITMSASSSAPKPGDKLTYTITVTNNGPQIANNVVVTDNLPAELTFLSCSSTGGGTCGGTGNTRTVTFPLMALNGTGAITFEATVNPSVTNGTKIDNIATVTSVTNDVISSNNTVIVSVIVATNPIAINCPANVRADAAQGQTSVVVNYPPPTIGGNPAGVIIACSPPSGSSFPVGVTTVVCSATDSANNKGSCGFSVTVNPFIPNNPSLDKTAIDFGPITLPNQNPPSDTFAILNVAPAAVDITLSSIRRTGSAVSGSITNPDDSGFYTVFVVNPGAADTRLSVGTTAPIPVGQQGFRVTFNPSIPAVAARSSNLAANQVLPDVVTSTVNFTTSNNQTLTINVTGRVASALRLIDPGNTSRPPAVSFTKSGDRFTLTYSVFDSNLDVSRASHEFLDSSGQAVGPPLEVNLSQALQSLGLTRGQSFTVEQPFSGASSHPEIAGVRLTVFDAETNVSATATLGASAPSVRTGAGQKRVTLRLPRRRLDSVIP
ncbi:MAG TPA: FG-GAP-like repeat-containing protein [Blastocatellia bacterium]|nr:FG-GAP-like repeat-containing protein [Blastocatellia bacterium]